ncbi:hypothetical protein [Ensifer sp. ZNC0028]|uniref:hypothetical protein n=1 Tax=Ensifer sp. ZNC0028 TaxID=1339236 RepID=UPI0005B8F8C9|nr:hypothetical protein [Ensifer sp. ZNC0028]
MIAKSLSALDLPEELRAFRLPAALDLEGEGDLLVLGQGCNCPRMDATDTSRVGRRGASTV